MRNENQNINELILSMHNLMRKVLPYVKERKLEIIAKKAGLSKNVAIVGLDMLVEKGLVIKEELEKEFIELDKFGKKFINSDLPEILFLKELLKKKKCYLNELDLDKEIISGSLNILKKENLISFERNKEGPFVEIIDETLVKTYIAENSGILKRFKEPILKETASKEIIEIFNKLTQRKRFLKISKKKDYEYILTDFGKEVLEEFNSNYKEIEFIETIDRDMILNESWRNKVFRHYDLNVKTSLPLIGRRHPMIESNNIIRDIFIEMGFKEMEGPIVESEFWCFDALWIPQDHPARDEQDTFFLDGEAEVPKDIVQKVKDMHENGIKRSHTPKNGFSMKITKRRILRTHSTATTFRYLYELGKKNLNGENVNGKYYYCAHNFRNEAIDATHLPEFFQAEGFIIADNLSLADLMGFIKEFYKKLGIENIRFKPTFNPYTEPSMEAHYYNEKLDKWYALINSGIFREETLKPLGLANKTIIAWGMGASRLAALLSGVTNLRQLTGYTCDFEWLKSRPLMKRNINR